jgi:hypothetical protein
MGSHYGHAELVLEGGKGSPLTCDAHGLTLDWIYMGDDRGLSPPLRNAIHALRQMQLEGV